MRSLTFHILMASLVGSTTVYYKEGSNSTLTCHIPANVSPIQWIGPKGRIYTIGTDVNPELPHHHRIGVVRNHSEYKLQILNVQQIDEGVYSCLFGINNVIKFQLFLIVQLTSVRINPSGSVSVQNSNIQQFQCSTRSLPHAVIKWYLNSVHISEMSNTTTNNTVTSVYIYTADKDDNGKHIHCNATSDGSIVRSLDAILDITYGPDGPLTLFPPDTAVVKIEGEHLGQIRCVADCNPSCQYEWTKDSQMVVQGDTLAIQSLRKTDYGMYRCRSWNAIGNNSIEFMLTVNYGPAYTNILPANNIYTVQEFTPLPAITCNTDCRPTCTKYWVGPNSQVNHSDILNLMSIKRGQAGTYTCYVNNTVSSSSSISVAVIVTYGPGTSQALDPPHKSIVKIKGDRFDPVQCSARCNPACQYEWTKDSHVVVHGDTLSIQSLVKTDHGIYRCRAWNSIGDTYTTMNLTVNYGASSANLSPDKTTYMVQEFTQLPVIICNTDCRPTCTKYWIGPNSQVNQTDTLNIRSIRKSQAGTYKCYVNNTISSFMSTLITVIVTYAPIIGSIEGNTTYFVNDTAELGCYVESIPLSLIMWKFVDVNSTTTLLQANDEVTESVFRISPISCLSMGLYRCEAVNSIGVTQMDLNVTVMCGPILNTQEYDIVEIFAVNLNETLNLTVPILAYPKPWLFWQFQKNQYLTNVTNGVTNTQFINRHTSTLIIHNIEKDDFGLFVIYGGNGIGNIIIKIGSFHVVATRNPGSPTDLFASCKSSVLMLIWRSGFNGGDTQIFTVELTKTKTGDRFVFDRITDPGYDKYVTFRTDTLTVNSKYRVLVRSANQFGQSNSTVDVTCESTGSPIFTGNTQLSLSYPAGIGTGIGITALIVIITLVIIALIRMKRKNPPASSYLYEDTECKADQANIYNELGENRIDGNHELITRCNNRETPSIYDDVNANNNQVMRGQHQKGPKTVHCTFRCQCHHCSISRMFTQRFNN